MAGTLTIEGMASGLLSGQNTIGPETMVGFSTVGERIDVQLASGDNTIAVPSGSGITVMAVLIMLPYQNTAEIKLRTNLNSGDSGLPVGPTGYVVFPLYAGTTEIILNAAAATGQLEAVFI